MKNRSAFVVLGVLASSLGLMSCASPQAVATCESSIASITPIERFDGMDYLTSSELAATVAQCDGADSWMDGLRAHPEVVDTDEISADDAEVYLASSCQLLADRGQAIPGCEEARERGYLL